MFSQVAKGCLQSLRNVTLQSESTLRRCRLEEAQLEWNVGNGARARLMLRSLLTDLVTIYRGHFIFFFDLHPNPPKFPLFLRRFRS